jgi:hypothetical protein
LNRLRPIAVVCFTLLGFTSTQANAHFTLVAPASWAAQDSVGSPQKSAPCGQADPGMTAVPSGVVATVQQGSKLTITINETIFHPGHYRVSLAADQASLPADPPVTAGSTACGSTQISTNPTLPLLADGLLVHTTAFSGPQTVEVQLPAGMTCTNCTLQVTEFMSQHGLNTPGGCFYHHCANVSITATGSNDGGSNDGGDASTRQTVGCGCNTDQSLTQAGLFGLLALVRCARRRRVS